MAAKKKSEKGSKLPVPAHPATGGVMEIGGMKFKVAKVLTVPVIRQKEGETVYITVTSPMFVGNPIKQIGGDGKEQKREPATLMRVRDLQDGGVEKHYICTAVVKGNLRDQYPDDTYVGHSFMIRKGAKSEGKQYRDMEIIEITPG